VTEFERWQKLEAALRIRLSQAIAKEDRCKDEMSKMCCRYAAMTLKDAIRIMQELEKRLCRSWLGTQRRLTTGLSSGSTFL
jgi:hypothetical protein